MTFLKRKNKYEMDVKSAGKMLENVFAACNTEPNQVPFDKIVLRSKQNLFTDNLFIVVTIVLFLITFVAPLFFPHGSSFLSVDSNMGRPLNVIDYQMTTESFSITFDGNTIDAGSSYMLGADDVTVMPSEYDRKTNTITFPYTPQEYNIYVFDINGRCIHLLLAPRK